MYASESANLMLSNERALLHALAKKPEKHGEVRNRGRGCNGLSYVSVLDVGVSTGFQDPIGFDRT